MSNYKPKKFRPLSVIAWSFRALAELLRLWPLLLIFLVLVSPISPHMRWTYTYTQYGAIKVMQHCQYLGARGLVDYMQNGGCPFIVLLDRR